MRWRKERKKIVIIYRPSAALISKYLHRPEKKTFRSTSRFDQMNLKGIVQSKIYILSTFNFVHTVIAIECCSSQYFIVFSRVKESYSGLNNTMVITELSILRQTIPLYLCVCVCVCVRVCVCFTLILSAMYSEASRRVEWAVSVSVVMNQLHSFS